jgi:glycosyltransferase involved in cell wall biosynthesis
MTQPLLSIGMIVKNEERCLEKCLKALEPLRQAIPCELVIADTGSTDKTKEIASRYADILFDFKWVDDFSKARNAVMDKCSGKWFLTVDADEYLIPDTNEIVAFLNSPSAQNKIFATVVIRNYGDIEMKGTFSDFNALRMVRMNTGIRYEGAIHESLTVTNIEQIHVLTDTIFDHDGYAAVSPEHLIEKEKRNLKLLEEKLMAAIPCWSFGAEGNIRLSYACSEENIREAVKRLAEFCASLRK